jgi:hypothetical protein
MRRLKTADNQQNKHRMSKRLPMDGHSNSDTSVGHAHTTSSLDNWRRVGLLLISTFVACAATPVRSTRPVTENHCPPGTHNYGDGMVASLLSSQAEAALWQAHAAALQGAGPHRSSFLADQPWRPHVSVIYGVTDDKVAPALQALQGFLASSTDAPACFAGLRYWDDETGGKTTLVIDVEEPAGLLSSLHDALAEAARIGSRFAYHPHVTLLYLQAHARLSADQQAAVLALLRGVCWPSGVFYLTDPCGQEIRRIQVPVAQRLPADN